MASQARNHHIAGISRWFPQPSETFVYDEVCALERLGGALTVFTGYGRWRGPVCSSMSTDPFRVERAGLRLLPSLPRDIAFWRRRSPAVVRTLWRTVPLRRWSDGETAAENLWAFLFGHSLARRAAVLGVRHLHAWWANGPATAAWVAGALARIPFSFSAWAGDVFPPDGALAEKIAAAAFVRATSAAVQAHLRGLAGGAPDKIRVLHNGQDARVFTPRVVPMAPPYRVLALGRFVEKKGFEVLLQACTRLRDQSFPFQLTLAGGGPQGARLARKVRSGRLNDRVSFPGFLAREDARRLFREADIFVMPSVVDRTGDRDGIPNVIMESLLSGVPVVASDVGGIGELVRHHETGLLVPPGDPNALAAVIREMAAAPANARALAARGRQLVRSEFDLETNARRLLRMIEGSADG